MEMRDHSLTRQRANTKADEDERKPKPMNRSCTAFVVFVFHTIQVRIDKTLEAIGGVIARRGLVVFVATLVVLGLLCLGYIRVQKTDWPPELFECRDNQARNDIEKAGKLFHSFNTRRMFIKIEDKSSDNILKSSCVDAAGNLSDKMKNWNSFKGVCKECSPTSSNVLKGLKTDQAWISTARKLNTVFTQKVMRLDNTLALNEVEVSFDSNKKQYEVSAKEIIVTLYVRRPKSSDEQERVMEFQNKLSKELENLPAPCTMILGNTNNEDQVRTIVTAKSSYLFYSLPPLVLIGSIFAFLVDRSVLSILAFLSVSIVTAVCVVVAFGVFTIFLIPFHDIYLFIPFFVYSIAMVSCLLFVKCMNNVKHWSSLKKRVCNCMSKSGFLITVALLVIMLLLGIGAWSCVPAITRFLGLMFLTVFLMYSALLGILLPILVWYSNLPNSANKHVSFGGDTRTQTNKHFSRMWVNAITSLPGKIVLLLIFAFILVGSIYVVASKHPTKLDSHTVHQIVKEPKLSSTNEYITLMFRSQINYKSSKGQNDLVDLSNKLSDQSYSDARASFWLASLQKWNKLQKRSCTGNQFESCFESFLNDSLNSLYKRDVKLQDNAFVLHLPVTRVNIDNVEKVRDLVEKSPFRGLVTVVSPSLPALKDVELFLTGRLKAFILALAIVTFILFFMTASLRTPFVLLITFILLTLEKAALIYLFSIPLNQLTFICCFPVLVIGFSFSVYVAQAFILSKVGSEKGKVIEAVSVTSGPILAGACLLLLCCTALGFGFEHLAVVFQQVVPLFLTVAVLHALAVIPAITSTYGKLRQILGISKLRLPFMGKRQYTSRQATRYIHEKETEVNIMNTNKVAIIGIACRFPTAPSKDEFWKMLQQGRCSVTTTFPANRPYEHGQFHSIYHPKRFVSGRISALGGSYMDSIRGFDSSFFKISQQEANAMDPQQRILLEVVYEAIEDSGMKIEDLQACRTGIFVGCMNTDYANLVTDDVNLKNMDQFAATGMTGSIISNRISFCFNFTGPSFTVDTACSSSLTAFKLAIDSLQNGDCEAAIVCAPNIVLSHKMHMTSSLAGLLAPDGRCKSFDASGDGYGRGEGFAAVVLKLTGTALNDGDDVYCEIVACGLNNDGAYTVPMTAPSARSQANLFRLVLQRSGLDADDIDYVEAHGTGTAIGDVVETTSIADAYCDSAGEEGRLLRIGSVKSNINHTESTSGLAGLIKLALMIKNQSFVPTVNVHTLNPRLKLPEKGLMVQTVLERWERRNGKPRIGAVSSYGFGGSNAHAIVREVTLPTNQNCSQVESSTLVMTLSARSKESLHDGALGLAKWLKNHGDFQSRMSDVCYSLNERRTIHNHRLALAFQSGEEAIKLLNEFGCDSEEWKKRITYGVTIEESQKLVFMFGGQGPQWYAMGRQLIENEPTFKATMEDLNILLKLMGEEWDLLKELMADERDSKLDELVIGQTATFALQYSIARLLISWGIYPSAVIGHSLGEYTASVISGAISPKEALSLVLLRAKLQEKCPENGAMAALGMSEYEATRHLIDLKLETTANVACVNDPKSVTLSGDAESIGAFRDYLTVNNVKVFWRDLNTPRAFHSAHMASIEKAFKLAGHRNSIKPKETAIAFYSTVEGEVISGKELNHSYWWRNIRQPVRFYKAMKAVLLDGYRNIIEIGAQPTLAHYVKQIAAQELPADDKPFIMATLPRRKVRDQHKAFMQNTVCELFVSGYPIQLSRACQYGERRKFIRPPSYSWQEKEYWFRSNDPAKEVVPLTSDPVAVELVAHPFLDKTVQTKPFTGLTCWETEIDLYRLPYLKDHALTQGGAIMPGVTYLEMAFAMAKEGFMCSSLELEDVKLLSLLTLPEGQIRNLRLRLMRGSAIGKADYQITSVQEDQTELLLSSGRIHCETDKDLMREHKQDELETVSDNVKSLLGRMKLMPVDEFQELTKRFGFSYGPAFSVIRRIWKGDQEGLCLMELDESLAQNQNKYIVHPSLLDACLQSCFVPISDVELSNKSIVPVGWECVSLVCCSSIPKQVLCHVKSNPDRWGHFDITMTTLSGQPIVKMKGFRIAELNISGKTDEMSLGDVCYNVTWKEAEFPTHDSNEFHWLVCLVMKDNQGFGSAFIEQIKKMGAEVFELNAPKEKDFATTADEQVVAEIFGECLRRCEATNKRLAIVNFWPVEANGLEECYDAIDKAQNISLRSSLFLMKLLFDNPDMKDAQIVMVTHNSQYGVVMEEPSKEGGVPWSSIVWGMRRTAALETRTLRVRAVDLSHNEAAQEISMLINELAEDNEEEEVAFRNGKRYVNRYVRLCEENVTTQVPSNIKQNGSRRFYMTKGPTDKSITLKANTESKIPVGEVEVELSHVFSLKEEVCGLTEGTGYVSFSGIVRAGNSGTKFRPNDKVCGLVVPRRIGNIVRVQQSNLMIQPEGFDDVQSTMIPFCASIAFKVLEKSTPEKNAGIILIHEADKAIAYTAVSIAKALGHRVVCTIKRSGTSTDAKRLLLDLGVEAVADISCLDLPEDYNGKCDTVLFMSPPKPGALQRSFATLKSNGKLVIACHGFNRQVVLPGDKPVSYERINVVDVINRAASFEELWQACIPVLSTTGMLQKLRSINMNATDVFTAVETWNNSKEKSPSSGLFLSFKFDKEDKGRLPVLLPGVDNFGLKSDRTYMVAGGVRGFGFEIARWMAENGAHTVVLLGRSAPNEDKKKEVKDLEERTGARVIIEQVDLSNEEEMRSLEVKLEDLPNMAGIVITAMVLRDNLISIMELDSFRDVLAPKVKGTFLLHQMSLRMDLDFFVMFSSLSSVIGNTGQASYAAGNAFQDALASYRRQVLGLPGLAVNWGPIGGAGVMTREKHIVDLLASAGFDLLDAKQGAKIMMKVMECQPSRYQISLTEMRWAAHLKQNANLARSTRVESLKNEADTGNKQSGAVDSLASKILLEQDSSKRTVMIEEFVYATLAYWAGMESFSEAEKTASLYSFGVDSTAALTLKMSFEGTLDVSFEVFYFMQPDTTAAKIVTDLQAILCEPSATQQLPEPLADVKESMDSLADEDKGSMPRPKRSTNKRSSKLLMSIMKQKTVPNGLAHVTDNSCKVVPLYTPEKAQIKFFCVHPSHRYAMSVAPFATGFKFQELVSMYAIGFTEPTVCDEDWDSVRQLALDYIGLIRGEQRHGPYFLGGYSFGGIVAYEMANILTSQSERVEFVAMIDTYAWLPPTGGFGRLASWFTTDFSPVNQVEVEFEVYLSKLAVKSLKMTESECESLRSEHSIHGMMEYLQQRSRDLDVPLYDLRSMWDSLLHDQLLASTTHDAWEPPDVQYEGPVTYIRSEDPKYSPTLPQYKTSDKAWAEVLIGPIDVCICPGHHFSLSGLPYARSVGNVLANSISIRYRTSFPELYRFPLDYKQRQAVRQFTSGVDVVLYAKKDRKMSRPGKLFVNEEQQVIQFSGHEQYNKNQQFQGKTVHLQDVRSVLPGKYVRNAIKQWSKGKKLRNGKHWNLNNVVTVIGQRMYHFEFAQHDDVQAFVCLMKGFYNIELIHPF